MIEKGVKNDRIFFEIFAGKIQNDIYISKFLALFPTKLINKDKHKRAGISNMTYFVLSSYLYIYIYPGPIRLGTQALKVDPF